MELFIVANWKLNPSTRSEAKRLFNLVNRVFKSIKNKDMEVVICPPSVYLPELRKQKSSLKLGAQNCFWEEKGAFTGEVSSSMLKDLGCQYVILGHSERRGYFSETNEMVNKKIKAAISTKLKPILCIGETEVERKKGLTQKVLRSQIKKGLKKITKQEIKKIIIAYEPIWAIGTGKACSPKDAKRAAIFIRKIISKIYNQKTAKKIPVLYGGSANSQNAAPYIFEANFQGLLVGGASLNPKEFVRIIKNVNRA